MDSCIFCRIVAGQAEASVVYEDDATLAFMNQRQANPGHVLVIPRAHIATIYELPPDLSARLFQTVVRTARAIERQLQPPGLNIWQSNGEAAGQEVFHVHVHLLPRRPGKAVERKLGHVETHRIRQGDREPGAGEPIDRGASAVSNQASDQSGGRS